MTALEDALRQAATDPRHRSALYHALWEGDLLVPQPGSAERAAALVHGGDVQLPVLESEGRRYLPVFTSEDELRRSVPADVPCVRLTGRALAGMWETDLWMAVNPRGEVGAILSPGEVLRLPHGGPDDQQFVVGEPAEEPAELLDLLGRWASSRPEVRALYRALLLVKDSGRGAELVVGVETDEGADAARLMEGAKAAGRESGIASLAFLPVRRDRPGTVATYMLEHTTPFYERT